MQQTHFVQKHIGGSMARSSNEPKNYTSRLKQLFSCCGSSSQTTHGMDAERAAEADGREADVEAMKKRQAARHIAELAQGT